MAMSLETKIKTALRPIPDYPKLGTTFYDSVGVFRNGALLKEVVTAMIAPFEVLFISLPPVYGSVV